jgi:hypothetical protein
MAALRQGLPGDFSEQFDMSFQYVSVVTIGASPWVPRRLQSASKILVNSRVYALLLTVLCWSLSVGVVLDSVWTGFISMIGIWTLGVGLVLRIDVSRWRVVLGTVRNIYVLVGALGCAATASILTGSEAIAQANVIISFVVAALFIPPFEIMDIPAVLGTYLVIPPIVV